MRTADDQLARIWTEKTREYEVNNHQLKWITNLILDDMESHSKLIHQMVRNGEVYRTIPLYITQMLDTGSD